MIDAVTPSALSALFSNSGWWLSAYLMGLLGGTHCVGMCGGLSSALTYALPATSRKGLRLFGWQLLYNSGRLLTYVLLGLAAGLLFFNVHNLGGGADILRTLAGLLMVLLGAYLAGWFQALSAIERLGGPIWRRLEPLRRRLMPVRQGWQAVAAGMIWGFLPCGLVYAALGLAVTRAAPLESGFTMLAFGLGTLPTLMLTGTAASQFRHLLQRPGTRKSAGILVILFGLWTIIGIQLMHGHHHGHGMDHSMMGHDMAGMKMN